MKIHHIGYLVKKEDKAQKAFETLGYRVTSPVFHDDYRGADIVFLEKDGYAIELVSPVSKESVVYDLMKKLGNTAYHICYESDEFEKDIENLENTGYVKTDEPHGAVAFENRPVCFLIHPYLGMVEVLKK